jgi:PAS domain S-box-containing protein
VNHKQAPLNISHANAAIYQRLFEASPSAIWLQDWSAVKPMVEALRARGVGDFAQYFEDNPDFVAAASAARVTVDFNPMMIELLRAPDREALFAELDRRCRSRPSEGFRQRLAAFAQGTERVDTEETETCLDGDIIHVRVIQTDASDNETPWGCMLGMAEDITDRKLAENTARQSEERLRLVTDNMPTQVSYFDANQRFRFVNRAYEKKYGLDRSKIEGKQVREIFGESRYQEIKGHIETVLSGEAVNYNSLADFPTSGLRRIDVSLVPHRGENGDIEGAFAFATDVTERIAAEEALRESEETFRSAFETAAHGMSLTAPDGSFLAVNNAFCNMLGYSEEELLTNDFKNITHPDDVEHDNTNFRALVANEVRSYQLEKRYVHKQGHAIYALVSVSLIKNSNGEPLYSVGHVQDISEHKRAERALRESEFRLRAIIDNAPVNISLKDLAGRFVVVSSNAMKFFELSPEDSLGKTSHDLFPADLADSLVAEDNMVLETGEPSEHENVFELESGERMVLTVKFPIPGEDGEPVGIGGISMDITERKRAEKALQESEKRFRDFGLAASDWFWEMDENLRYTHVSERGDGIADEFAREMIGRTRKEIGNPDDDSDKWAKHFADLEAHRPFRDFRYRLIASGRPQHMAINGMPIFDDRGNFKGYRGSAADISELIEAEETLRRAQRMEAVGQLTGGIAHDFNNLLAVIMGNVELVAEQVEGDATVEPLLEIALGAAESGANLTRQLLAFSRQQPLDPTTVDANDMIGKLANLARHTLDVTYIVETALSGSRVTVFVDPVQLESALLNLVLNARDAMAKGGSIRIETGRMASGAHHDDAPAELTAGDYVTIAVNDQGTGMEQHVLDHAFEPFFTTKGVGEGSGLGLSMVYGFVKQSGGQMVVHSAESQGTTVVLYLPAVSDTPDVEVPATPAVHDSGAGKTVLLVEDDDRISNLTASMLTGLGYSVVEAGSGDAALELLGGGVDIDLMIVDIVLPGGLNGIEFVAEARRGRPDLPALYVSAYPMNALLSKGHRIDDIDFLQKPYRKADLLAILSDVLETPSAETRTEV